MIKLKDIIKEAKWSDRKWGDPLPTLEDVMNEVDVMSHVIKYKDEDGNEKEITVKSALQAGDSHPAYKQASDIADKGQAGLAQKDKEEPKSKGLEPDDFERDGGEPEDKPHGGDTGKDADFKGEPPEGAREPDDDEPSGNVWANSEGDEINWDEEQSPEDLRNALGEFPKWSWRADGWSPEREYENLLDDYEGEYSQDEPDEKHLASIQKKMEKLVKKHIVDKKESIKVINGKKYKAIKEAKKPTLLYESKIEIRKMWNRIK